MDLVFTCMTGERCVCATSFKHYLTPLCVNLQYIYIKYYIQEAELRRECLLGGWYNAFSRVT